MKYLAIFCFFILCIAKSNAQECPFFQQLAFNFYAEKIIKEFPVNEKLRISKSLNYSSENETYYIDDCLKKSVPKRMDSIHFIDFSKYLGNLDSNRFELNLDKADKKQFRIKRKLRDNFPELIVLFPKVYKDRIFVAVHQKYEREGTYYTIEFNSSGEIIDWCQSSYVTVFAH
jgi:hypothetical protein